MKMDEKKEAINSNQSSSSISSSSIISAKSSSTQSYQNEKDFDDNKYKQVRSYSEPNILSTDMYNRDDAIRTTYTRQSTTLYPYIKQFNAGSKYSNGKKQYYAFFCLGPKNPIRALAILITESKLFEYFILVAILFTCIVMALDAPLPQSDKSKMNKIAEFIEYFLLGIFLLEAVLKIIAMGFVLHPNSYLRSIWNILDFIVLVFGIITLFPESIQSFNIKPLRAVRVLRPLKLISGIPSLQVVMTSIVRAMFPLLQVLFLVVFVIIIYSIIGLEFFVSRFHYSCKYTANNTFVNSAIPCDIKRQDDTFYYVKGRACPNNQSTCQRYNTGLNHGITSFDNIFLAMITVFQCITMEGWTDIMYHTFGLLDEHGYIWSSYYISLIVVGSFFMLNLVLGVLSGEFAKEREKVENRREFLKLRTEQQVNRICDSYLEWISRGEDILIQEQSEENNNSSPSKSERANINIIANPALVFQTSNNEHVSNNNHRKSKFDRLQIYIKMLRLRLRNIVKNDYFFWLVICMVFINTIIMSTKHYLQPPWLTDLQATAEKVFISIFTVELFIKLFAYGVTAYFKSLFNCFDFVVVILSILELIVITQLNNSGLGLSVLRSLRLLRIFKVTKYWSSLRNLVTSLMNAIKSILSLMFLLFLFIVISALLGMQLFGGKFVKLETFPRTNFDTFPDSLLAVFQVITGEDWNVVMYDGIMAYGGPKTLAGVCISLYFIFLVIFGNYTLLNVFLAIAVDNLTNAQILTHDEEAEEVAKHHQNVRNALQVDEQLNERALFLVNNLKQKALDITDSKGSINVESQAPLALRDLTEKSREDLTRQTNGDLSTDETSQNGAVTTFNNLLSPGVMGNGSAKKLTVFTPEGKRRNSNLFDSIDDQNKHQLKLKKKWIKIVDMNLEHPDVFLNSNADDKNGKIANDVEIYDDEGEEEEESIDEKIKDHGILNVLKVNVGNRRRIIKAVPIVQKSSLFIFGPSNGFRKICHQIIHFRYFDWFIMFVILISSLTLALEDPVNDNAKINEILRYFDYIFTVIFGLEVILKVVDAGFVLHKGSYLRNSWNVLDIFVFLCNLTSIILSTNLINAEEKTENIKRVVKTLRVLRVLRPLKAIHKVKKLKAVFQCMIYSLKNVTFVLIITWLILFIFACIGVELYQGKFYYCTDRSKMNQQECQGDYYKFPSLVSVVENKPKVEQRKWMRYDFHFDNIFDAFLTLYTSSTGEGWPSSMHNTIDATSEGQGPIKNNRQYMAIYYIVFVVIFTFMIINIYIALIILTFQRQGEKEIEGGLDRNQRDCIQFVLNAKPRVRYMPTDRKSFTYHVWFVVDSRAFEYFIMALIILNTLQLMMKYDGNSKHYTSMLMSLNIAFTAMFCLEAALKIIAYRVSYFKDLWNLFDLVVILGSLGDIILSQNEIKFIDPSMFRLCRAARIIKLLRKGASIRVMLWTFVQSFKALPYVTCLILLLFYIYAVVGMQTFGKIALIEGQTIFKYNNFTSIIQALQVLLRCSTGESWNLIMRACYSDARCVNGSTNCGNTWISRIYFSSFIFFCMFLLLNLFVAVIMDNFEYLTRDSSILGPHHLDEFVRCWSQFDPKATGKVHHELLYKMMCHLTPPVGFGKKCPKSVAYKRLIRMNMPIMADGSVTFHTTLLALIRARLDVYVKGNMYNNNQDLRRVIQTIWPKTGNKIIDKLIPKYKNGDDDKLTVGKVYCVKLLVMNHRNLQNKNRSNSSIKFVEPKSPSVLHRFNSIIPSSLKKKKRHQLETIKSYVERPKSFSLRLNNVKQQNDHHTRDGQQVRRRSSWSDIPSFFRFNRDPPPPVTNDDPNNMHPATSKQGTSNYNQPGKMNSINSPHVNTTNSNKNKQLNRAPSLRTNSNGNVVSTHRRVSSNGVQSLQLDPLAKGSQANVRYQSNKQSRNLYTNSAPPTPRGSTHGSSPSLRQNHEHYGSNQSSPLSSRRHNSNPSQHRRGSTHTGSSFNDPNLRDPRYANNYNKTNNYPDQRQLEYQQQYSQQQLQQPYDSRTRTSSDPRRLSNNQLQSFHGRQELSKENLEQFNQFSSASSIPTSNLPNNSIHFPEQNNDRRTGSGNDFYRNDNRSVRYHSDMRLNDNRNVSFQNDGIDKYSLTDLRTLETNNNNRGQPNVRYQKHPVDNNYKPVESYNNNVSHHYQGEHEQLNRIPVEQIHRIPVDHRLPVDMNRNNVNLSTQKLYTRNDYVPTNDKQHPQSRVVYHNNGMPTKDRMSPKRNVHDNELLNGAPSQMYYDNMISQISNQIARVSEGGVSSQQPFNPTIQNSHLDEDDNEWC